MKNIAPFWPSFMNSVIPTIIGLVLTAALSAGLLPGSSSGSSSGGEVIDPVQTKTTSTTSPTEIPSITPAPPTVEPTEEKPTTPEVPAPSLEERESIVAAGVAQRGEVIGTGGKPAIALRFDHHLQDFEEKVLPLLEKYRLPWGQMINAGNMGSGEGMTFDELARHAHQLGGEVWNHGWSHASIYTEDEADREITQGLEDLRKGIPSLWIDGWAQPGQADYMGLDGNPFTAEHYYDTYPGRLVLAQHAFIRGYYPGAYHELEGSNLIGQSHVTIDRQVDGRINGYVRRAINDGTGVTLMLHPNYLDRPGYLTTEELDKSLAYIARLRDQDQIEVLSNTGILMAEDDLSEDHGNLLIGAGPGDFAGEWESAVPNALDHRGVPQEAEVWVSGTGTATLQVEVNSGSYPVAATHTIELTDEPKRMSVVVTPPMDTTSVSVSLTGDGSHQGISYQPL